MSGGDPAIRALLLPVLRATRPDALIVQEWRVGVGDELYADVASVGDALVEAWEIKSDVDSLARLERQVPLYGAAFDRCVLVTAARHLDRAMLVLAPWWGVVLCHAGDLRTQRAPQPNAGARLERLLWSVELKALVRKLGLGKQALERRRLAHAAWLMDFLKNDSAERQREVLKWQAENPPGRAQRADLVGALAAVPRDELAPLVCATLRARKDWRRGDGYRLARAS